MYQGKLNKAKRGELGFQVPIGYTRRPSGEICLDSDEQVQQVVRLIFRKKEWEEKLRAKQELEEEYQRFLQQQPHLLTQAERDAIEQLAKDIPSLWQADTTTNIERKEIIRHLIENIEAEVQGNSEKVKVTITWFGNVKTTGIAIRPVAKLKQLSYYPKMCKCIKEFSEKGLRAADIAKVLNQEGFRPPKRYEIFNAQGVREIMHRLGLNKKQTYTNSKPSLIDIGWIN